MMGMLRNFLSSHLVDPMMNQITTMKPRRYNELQVYFDNPQCIELEIDVFKV